MLDEPPFIARREHVGMSMVSLQRLDVVQYLSAWTSGCDFVGRSVVNRHAGQPGGNLHHSRRHARAAGSGTTQIDPRLAGHPVLANERLDLRRVLTAQAKHSKWVVASVVAE